MADFDPDSYLAQPDTPSSGGFNPDSYLASKDGSSSAPPQPTLGSIAKQTGLGAEEGLLNLGDTIDPIGRTVRAGTSLVNSALGTNYQVPTMADINKNVLGAVGANPDQYPAQNTPEKVARFAGSLLPGLAAPGGEGATLAKTAEAGVPSVDALLNAAKSAYKSPEVASIKLVPQAMKDLGEQISGKLMDDDIHPLLAPKTYGIVDQMTNVPEGTPFVTAANVQTLRRVLGKAAQSVDPTERMAAQGAQRTVDDFMANLPKEQVIDGDADAASSTLNEARGNYAAAMRTQRLDDATDKASRQAARAGIGGNYENATRQQISSILNSPAKSRGLSDDEKSALDDYVSGNFTRNSLRVATKVLGGDNPLMASIHAGAALGAAIPTGGLSLAGLVAPMTGYVFKKINNSLSDNELTKLNEMLRSRSPLGQQTQQAIAALAKAHINGDQGTIANAAKSLAGKLKMSGLSAEPAMLTSSPLQLPGAAAAQQNQQQVPGPPSQQNNGGRIGQKQQFAKGGTVKGKRFDPRTIGARLAKDGHYYLPDSKRPGKYLRVVAKHARLG